MNIEVAAAETPGQRVGHIAACKKSVQPMTGR